MLDSAVIANFDQSAPLATAAPRSGNQRGSKGFAPKAASGMGARLVIDALLLTLAVIVALALSLRR